MYVRAVQTSAISPSALALAEEISYFKMEAEEREFSNLFPSI